MLKFGSDSIGMMFIGDDAIAKAYLGSDLVFDGSAAGGGETPTPTPPSILPSGYTQLEYIESTGDSYFPIQVQQPFEVEIEFMPTSLPASSYMCIFGKNSNMQLAFNNTGKATDGSNSSSGVFFAADTKCTINAGFNSTRTSSYYHVNNVNTGLLRAFSSSDAYVFASISNGFKAKGRLYKFTISKDSAVIMDLIPCINPLSIVGMYDIVNDTFYSSTSGTSFSSPS